jgi:hypothetical protein
MVAHHPGQSHTLREPAKLASLHALRSCHERRHGDGVVLRLQEEHDEPASLDTTLWVVHCHSATEDCANPASWDEEAQVASSFNIRTAPFARGYFLGDYQGLTAAGGDVLAFFGSTVGIGPSSIYFNRLVP